MKLKKLLKNLDEWTNLIIWDQVGLSEESWEIVYKGIVCDVPWRLYNRHIIKTEDNDGDGGIAAYKTEDGDYGIRITLADE